MQRTGMARDGRRSPKRRSTPPLHIGHEAPCPGSMLPMHRRDAMHDGDGVRPRLQAMQIDESRHKDQHRGITLATPDAYATEKPTGTAPADVPPARWTTWEFRAYYLLALVVVPYMIYVPIYLSSESHLQYGRYAHYLVPGWMGGRLRVCTHR